MWIWKFSVITKEFGHFIALALFIILVIGQKLNLRGFVDKFQLGLGYVTCAIFLYPLTLALIMQGPIVKNLKTDFQAIFPQNSIVSFKTLFFGRPTALVSFQTVKYKDDLTFDYYPAQNTTSAPWILIIHGGGWSNGDSQQLPDLNSILASEGYAVFSINYRLSPKFKWPAQKEDAIDAVQFIKSNAERFKIKPDRWVVLGRSAGGQIAGSLAADAAVAPLGLILFYAPTDLLFGYEVAEETDLINSRHLIEDELGGSPDQAISKFADSSFLNYVSDKFPPTLMLHGVPDTLSWYKHSERLLRRLKWAKVPSSFVKLPWAAHGFDFNLNGPGGQISTFAIEVFLNKYLKD